ncbi:MAG: exo-alpha-sialidase [Clostridia bacterium]|nr:exo-alpha-sialidase [Clostridia bacterium]
MKQITKEFIFGEPLPVPENHASTILVHEDGTKLAAWFGGTKEGRPDVVIWVSRCVNGVWTQPKTVTPEYEKGVQHWNPVLFSTGEKGVLLFYKMGYPISDWHTRFLASYDFGESWSEPTELVPGDTSGGRGPVKNKPIRLSNGRILAPASTEQGAWRCFIDRFDGVQWGKSHIPVELPDADGVNVIQPTLWESRPGVVHALMRSNRGRLYRSDSTDGGETWSPIYPTEMPNNNSGIDCVRLEDGRVVLVCNPVGEDCGKRSPLSVFVSADNGKTFVKAADLETIDGEFSYPAIVAVGSRIHITYTHKRQKIVYCEFEMND